LTENKKKSIIAKYVVEKSAKKNTRITMACAGNAGTTS